MSTAPKPTPKDQWLQTLGVPQNSFNQASSPDGSITDDTGHANPSQGSTHATRSAGIGDLISWKFHDELKVELKTFGETSKFKGSLDVKIEATGELVEKGANPGLKIGGTTNKGVKGEIEIAKQKANGIGSDVVRKCPTALQIKEYKETASFEGSRKKIDISAGATAKIETPWSWLTGLVSLKFIVAGFEWDKQAKNPGDVSIGAVEAQGGVQGEETFFATDSYDFKLALKGALVFTGKPNWPVIFKDGAEKLAKEEAKKTAEEAGRKAAQEAAKKAAQEATKDVAEEALATETEGLAVDMGALSTAAATIVLPLAAIAAIGYGMYQESKLMKADIEAIHTGVSTRRRAIKAAESFANVLTGSKNSGDEGGQLAETEINRLMTQTHASRQQVTDAISRAQGGYQKIRDSQLERLRDKLYEDACRIFDESHRNDFGILEKQGETWGFRGSFRKMLRMVLYSDD